MRVHDLSRHRTGVVHRARDEHGVEITSTRVTTDREDRGAANDRGIRRDGTRCHLVVRTSRFTAYRDINFRLPQKKPGVALRRGEMHGGAGLAQALWSF